MKPKVETEKGWTEVIIDNDCEFSKFHKAANILPAYFNLTFTNQINDFDTYYLDFEYKGSSLVLFYNIYEGVTIFPKAFKDATSKDNEMAEEIGTLLFQKLIDVDWSGFEKGKTIGKRGSEGGKIIIDIENSNGARITLEKECESIPFAITFGIYGLMFHTHFESDLEIAKEYIECTKFRINKIFDLFQIEEERRNEFWRSKHDKLIDELVGND